MIPTRRQALLLCAALPLAGLATPGAARDNLAWSAREAHAALLEDGLRLLDIRSREEWHDTGVARGAWPVSMHERGFPTRLFAARQMAGDRPVGLICATGGRTAAVLQALTRAGENGFLDIADGMLGSEAGPGWIAAGLPVLPAEAALGALPPVLE